MIGIKNKFKKGAASFYIVAFSTLILMIIATSFAVVIISEVERTSNEDLSQSAYDSALAGVEDAKLAFYNYQNCILSGGGNTCEDLYGQYMRGDDCDAVRKMLGRDSGEIVESENDNNMQQSYTCVTVKNKTKDYRSVVSSDNTVKVMRAKFDDVPADKIKTVRVSWFSNEENETVRYTNVSGNKVEFPGGSSTRGKAVPPTISLAMIQTSTDFKLSDFDMTEMQSDSEGKTDRGMLYLVPVGKDNKNMAVKSAASYGNKNYIGAYDEGTKMNSIGADGVWKSNDKTSRNLPYVVYCSDGSDGSDRGEFMCSVEINLPKPVGSGVRNDDTFIFAVGLPYGEPDTDFALEFCTGLTCGSMSNSVTNETTRVDLKDVQVEVDSTGKANDFYRRVVTRLDNVDDFSLSIKGPLVLFGDGNAALDKSFEGDSAVTCEYNFVNPATC